jgi:hypothetical protein
MPIDRIVSLPAYDSRAGLAGWWPWWLALATLSAQPLQSAFTGFCPPPSSSGRAAPGAAFN